jgi:hypothetical protein
MVVQKVREALHEYNQAQLAERLETESLPNYYSTGKLVWYDVRVGEKTRGKRVQIASHEAKPL